MAKKKQILINKSFWENFYEYECELEKNNYYIKNLNNRPSLKEEEDLEDENFKYLCLTRTIDYMNCFNVDIKFIVETIFDYICPKYNITNVRLIIHYSFIYN